LSQSAKSLRLKAVAGARVAASAGPANFDVPKPRPSSHQKTPVGWWPAIMIAARSLPEIEITRASGWRARSQSPRVSTFRLAALLARGSATPATETQ
jgi:hypothetical protein